MIAEHIVLHVNPKVENVAGLELDARRFECPFVVVFGANHFGEIAGLTASDGLIDAAMESKVRDATFICVRSETENYWLAHRMIWNALQTSPGIETRNPRGYRSRTVGRGIV